LSDAHPLDKIDVLCERWIRFVCECGSNDFSNAGFSHRISEQSGINAVSGDDPKNVWILHCA
jgi:hypothetical protein